MRRVLSAEHEWDPVLHHWAYFLHSIGDQQENTQFTIVSFSQVDFLLVEEVF